MKINSKLFFLAGAFPLILAPKVMAYGFSTTNVPACDNLPPSSPWLHKTVASGPGSVNLAWYEVPSASSWTVAYGTQPGKYIYGLSGFGDGNSRSTTINHLPSGTYYFVVRANNGCKPGIFSNETKVSVSRGSAGARLVANTSSQDKEVVQPSTNPRLRTPSVSPSPKASLPGQPADKQGSQGDEQPAANQSLWQRLSSFFRGLFGK